MGNIQDVGQGRKGSEIPEPWVRRIGTLGRAEKVLVYKLLKVKRFKSTYRSSLRAILVRWLEGLPDGHSDRTPFSEQEWRSLGKDFVR